MKEKRNLFIGIILGALISWIIGFFGLPIIVKYASFLLGFIAGLVFVSLVLILLFFWNRNAFPIVLFGKNSTTNDSKNTTRSFNVILIFAAIIIALVGSIGSFLIINRNELSKTQTQHQNTKIEQHAELIESVRRSSMVFLMSNIFNKIDDELKNNPNRTLSDKTIARIAALSYSLMPYGYLEGDSLVGGEFSMERGQLLLALSKMNIDSSSFYKIKLKTSFARANLKGADLRGANLKGVNLAEANLYEANLYQADLREADLRSVNLWGANLKKANLRGGEFKMADMSWADLNGADLRGAGMNGVDLISAKLRGADLSRANLSWVNFSGASLNEANLKGANLLGAGLRRANLKGADLSETDVRGVDMTEAILTEVNFSGAKLNRVAIKDKNWLKKLDEWQVTGSKEIQENYKMVDDMNEQSDYMLEKIKN